jgi:hypothetical protein
VLQFSDSRACRRHNRCHFAARISAHVPLADLGRAYTGAPYVSPPCRRRVSDFFLLSRARGCGLGVTDSQHLGAPPWVPLWAMNCRQSPLVAVSNGARAALSCHKSLEGGDATAAVHRGAGCCYSSVRSSLGEHPMEPWQVPGLLEPCPMVRRVGRQSWEVALRLSHRRRCLQIAAGAAAFASLSAMPHLALAQAYPTKPTRLITGYTSGGSADIIKRAYEDRAHVIRCAPSPCINITRTL